MRSTRCASPSTGDSAARTDAAFASREPHAERPPGARQVVDGQQALEHGVPALGLRARRLGQAILRQLASEPEVAAPQTLRGIRRDD
jgi:hypothetical protein